MIKKVQKEHVPETESDCKTRSNFRALFFRVSRAFGCDQNVHVALVTRGARRSTRNLPYVTITHSYILAFFATRFLLLFRSHFCRNCSFTRRYQHDSVLELFLHFGRRTNGVPLRPIVSTIGSSTYKIAKRLNKALAPYAYTHSKRTATSETQPISLRTWKTSPSTTMR